MQSPSSQLKHTLVKAGAGAGKTRGLVEKIVDVYQLFRAQGQTPRIVLTTFTRKATQELKERLLTKACDLQDARLLQFVSDSSKLQISTIHGLLNIFLKQFGHLAGLEAGFQVLSEEEAEKMARQSLRDILVEHPEELAWLQTYGFQRLLAMCRRFVPEELEHNGLQVVTVEELEQMADLEFEKVRTQALELASTILEEVDEPKWVEYGQSLKVFARDWPGGELVGLPKKVTRSAKTKPWEHLHQRVDDFYDDIKGQFQDDSKSKIWDRSRWPSLVQEWRRFLPFAQAFARHYSRTKDQQGRLEMSDLELKTLEIVREHPELAGLFAANWDFWMIDEYQDTSPIQVACLKALMGENSKRYIVGDPQQSIYLFRGADVGVFARAQVEIESIGGEILHLRRNYRSRADLLSFMNDFMTSVASDFTAMEPHPEKIDTKLDPCALFWQTQDQESEVKAVVSRVEELLQKGARLDDICVLGRTHDVLLSASKALKSFGYPTHLHAARGFTERREIIDAGALWKFLVNPHDNLNLLTLLRSGWFYVEDYLLAEWMKERPTSLWRELESRADCGPSVQKLIAARKLLEQCSVASAFEQTLCSAAYLDLCLLDDPAGRKESNLWKLIWKARALSREGGNSLLDLLGERKGDPTESSEGDAASAQEPNCINLMTIHGSKGLEFEHIIVPGAGQAPNKSNTAVLSVREGKMSFPVWDDGDGEFVSSPMDYMVMKQQREREMREFDRWLYVAVTRAKSSLTLIWSKINNDSWASRSSWFKRAVGQESSDGFAVEIRDSAPEPNAYVAMAAAAPSIRPLWSETSSHASTTESATSSVTQLIEATKLGRTFKPTEALRRWQSQSIGLQIHRALEALKYGHSLADELPADTKAAVDFVLGLANPPMPALIETGQVEWGFQVKTERGVIEGQIDLWGQAQQKIFIVDYKTGSDRAMDDAFRQLSLYAWALRRFGHKDPMEMVIIYPLKKKIESRSFSDDLFLGWEKEFS